MKARTFRRAAPAAGLVVAAALAAGAAMAAGERTAEPAAGSDTVTQVERALERAARAAAAGIERGVRAAGHGARIGAAAAARGLGRAADATARAAEGIARRIEESASATPPAGSERTGPSAAPGRHGPADT